MYLAETCVPRTKRGSDLELPLDIYETSEIT